MLAIDLKYVDIFFDTVIVLLGIYLSFFKSYLTEKGKNLATKEDIDVITKKVEGIKSGFQYLSQSKFSIKSAERDALMDINIKYGTWLSYLSNLSFGNINVNNYEVLDTYFETIKVNKNNFDIAEARLHLFLHDEELMKAKVDCVIETIKYEYIIVETIAKMSNEYSLWTNYLNGLYQSNPNIDIKFINEQRTEFQKNLDAVFNKMNENKLKQFNIVHEKRVFFINTLQARLLNIMK